MLSNLLSHGFDIRAAAPPHGGPALHCMVASAGYEQRINEHYSWDGMRRGTAPFLVLQHTTFGEGRLDHAGARHRIGAGQTMLVTVPHPHRYFLNRGGHWEYFWMVIDGREALRLARAITDAAGPVIDAGPDAADRMAAACLSVLRPARLTPGIASAAGYAALAALYDAVFADGATTAPLPPAIARVAAFVETHLAEPLPVHRLAGIAGMSRAHFVRSFAAATGMAPSHFVTARRIERIERLLLATEMSVAQIAAATGFADGNYLAKAFRRARGMAPLAYRATRAGVA